MDDLVSAHLATPRVNPMTGEQSTVGESALAGLDALDELLDSDIRAENAPDLEAVHGQMSGRLHSDVPSGADARFAAAVCDAPEHWQVFGYFPAESEHVQRTPHTLRFGGRLICGIIRDSMPEPAESVYAKEIGIAERSRTDPVGYRDEVLTNFRTALEGMDESSFFAQQFAAEAEIVENMTPQQYSDTLEKRRSVIWAAVEHMCPAYSAVGFGDECGTVDVPESSTDLRLKIHTGDMSCDDAREAIDDYFHESLVGPVDTPWKCIDHSNFGTERGKFVVVACNIADGSSADELVLMSIDE